MKEFEEGGDDGVPGRCHWNLATPAEVRALGIDGMRQMYLSMGRRALLGRFRMDTMSTAADALPSLWRVCKFTKPGQPDPRF